MKSIAMALVLVQGLLTAAMAYAHWQPAAPPPPAPALAPAAWSPPGWFPDAGALSVLPDLDRAPRERKGPAVRSPAAIVADLDAGEVLWARDADSARSVASLTKLAASLAMASTQPDLDATLCVDANLWPSRPGARSKFETGRCHTGWEFVGAALVASDNRGAMAMAPLAGLPFEAFVARMAEVSTELGLRDATWAEPTGLEDENMASARDVLKLVAAVAAHPTLSLMASAPAWTLDRWSGPTDLASTNRLHDRFDTLAAKTGYTDTAHYSFATVVTSPGGRRLGVAVLGAPTSEARFADVARLVAWADGLSPR